MIINKLKNFFYDRKIVKEGGEKTSLTAREHVSKLYKVSVGLYTYGSCFLPNFNTGGEVTIGKYTSFGPNVRYFGANHPMNNAIMTPYFYRKEWGFNVKDVERKKLTIGNDCWIGNNVTIVSSCETIGDGAVIAAGAVVTKNIPPYAIVAGVPAKIIKYRFAEEIIALLQKSQWWELKPEQLEKYYKYIENPLVWASKIAEDNTGK